VKALQRRAKACELTKDLQQSLEDVTAACILEGFQNQTTLLTADRVLKELGMVIRNHHILNFENSEDFDFQQNKINKIRLGKMN
jgi:import receptor subunit TOM70